MGDALPMEVDRQPPERFDAECARGALVGGPAGALVLQDHERRHGQAEDTPFEEGEGTRGSDGVLKGGYRGQKATLSKFTVDYTVCIFCGLCEEPCPPTCIFLGPDFDYHATDRTMMEKNLLTDEVFTEEDERFVQWARGENERLVADKKRRSEEEKKAIAAKAATKKDGEKKK